MFSDIDDLLIDCYFQPACDAIRRTTGWSKGIPTAITLMIAIIGLVPLAIAAFFCGFRLSWIFFLPAFIMLLWIIISTLQVYSLLSSESRKDQCADALNPARLTGERDRKWTIALSLLALPLALVGCTYPDTDLRIVSISYLIGGAANFCVVYFKACTDIPPPNQTAWRALFRRWFFPSRLAQE